MTAIPRPIMLTVYGPPAPKGSLKCVGRGKRHQLVENSDRTKPWRARVVEGGKRLPPEFRGLDVVALEVTFTIDRPAGHYRTGRNAHLLRADAPLYPSRRSQGLGGDVDKLARVILDALEDAGVLRDDAAVIELTARKSYADGPGVLPDALDRPGARIRLTPL